MESGVWALSGTLSDTVGALELPTYGKAASLLEGPDLATAPIRFHYENAAIFLFALAALVGLTLTAMRGKFSAFELMLILAYMAFSLAVNLHVGKNLQLITPNY